MNDMTDNNADESLSAVSDEQTSWAALRESKGISLEEIAQQTNIAMHKLEALEKRDFEVLGTETFALGYMRRYAKIVEVDPQILIDAYKASRPDEDASEIPAAKYNAKQNYAYKDHYKESKPRKIPMAAISIVILVIWIGIMFFLPDDEAATKEATNPAKSNSQTAGLDGAGKEQVLLDVADDAVDQNVGRESNVSGTSNRASSSLIEPAGDDDSSVQASVEGMSGGPSATDGSSISTSETSESITAPNITGSSNGGSAVARDDSEAALANDDVEQRVSPRGSESPSGTEDVIVMSFTDDCWVEIKDAQGDVIFAQLQTKEDNLQIFGQAPFEVMLGNARAATVSLNGEVVSTTPPGGKKTLRMTVSN